MQSQQVDRLIDPNVVFAPRRINRCLKETTPTQRKWKILHFVLLFILIVGIACILYYFVVSDIINQISIFIPPSVSEPGCTNTKKYLVACFMSLFLGAFGVDRVYLGYWVIGMIELIIGTCLLFFSCCKCICVYNVDTKKLKFWQRIFWWIFLFTVFIFSIVQLIFYLLDLTLIVSHNLRDSNNCTLT